MQDLGILEIVIAFFLFMYLIRPYIKSLWNVSGLVWFPLLALVCTIGLFPTYGFRPECLPLLIFCLVINAINFPMLQAVVLRLHNTDYRERGPLFFFISFFFFAAAMITAIYFMPNSPAVLSDENAYTIKLNDNNIREYYVRLYDPVDETDKTNLIIVVPPVIGSIDMIDNVCGFLRDGGFRVITFSRKGFDLPSVGKDGAIYLPSFKNIPILSGCFMGKKFAALEEERTQDIGFFFSYIKNNVQADTVAIIAYNEGAASVLKRADTLADFFPMPVRGLISIQSSKQEGGRQAFVSIDDSRESIPMTTLGSVLQYSDIPEKYPIITAIASDKTAHTDESNLNWKTENASANTAAIILNFIAEQR